GKASRRPLHTAAGWFALMLRSIAARRERRRFHSPSALRCVSKHEGHAVAGPILRAARTPGRLYANACPCTLLRMRTNLAFSPAHDVKQPISVPRRMSASGGCDFASLTPHRGVGGAPRDVRVLGGTPVGRAHDAARQALAALRPMTRD